MAESGSESEQTLAEACCGRLRVDFAGAAKPCSHSQAAVSASARAGAEHLTCPCIAELTSGTAAACSASSPMVSVLASPDKSENTSTMMSTMYHISDRSNLDSMMHEKRRLTRPL